MNETTLNFFLELYERSKHGSSPLLDTWPLFGSPLPICSILLGYVVVSLWVGPALMKNSDPLELKHLMIVYNGVQILFNFWMFVEGLRTPNSIITVLSFGCAELPPEEQTEIEYQTLRAWWFFTLSKLIDLIDTLFFLLRKKFRQISYLHVQHHTLALFATWFYGKYWTGQEWALMGFINVFIHVWLYFYYLLTSLGPKLRKYLGWKKNLTQIQIVQFVINIAFLMCSFFYLRCGFNPVKVVVGIFINVFNLVLFANFYYDSYIAPAKRPRFHHNVAGPPQREYAV